MANLEKHLLERQLLEKQLNETLNPDNTINISELNNHKQRLLQGLEDVKNLSLKIKNNIKTSSYEKLQQQFNLLNNMLDSLNDNDVIKRKIYENYKEKIIKGNYTNATEAIKIIDDFFAAYEEVQEIRNSVYQMLNNRKMGTLSQLALNALPKTEEEFKNKLTESFGEDANIDEYMSVYDFEKNKDKLQKEYNPKNESSGGRKTKRRHIKKYNKSKSKKAKRYMKTISNLKRRTKHYKK